MAEETDVPVQTPQPTPYIDKVYSALKDNLQGFNKTPEQFKQSMQDSGYAAKAYSALKDNLQGFNKSQDEFYQAAGVKSHTQAPAQPSNAFLNPLQPQQAVPFSGVTKDPALQQQLLQQGQQQVKQEQDAFRAPTQYQGAKMDYSDFVKMPKQVQKPSMVHPTVIPTDRSNIKNPRLITNEEDKQAFGTGVKPQKLTGAPVETHADTWGNIGSFLPHTVLAGLQKDAGQALQFIGGKIGEFRDNTAINKSNNDINTRLGLTDRDYGVTGALTQLGLHLENAANENQATADKNNLPNTTMGGVAKSAIGFIPDIIELAVTPELDVAKLGKLSEVLTKYGGKYVPKVVGGLGGKFPVLMGTKGLTSGYAEGKEQGMSDYDATGHGLVKSAEEYGKGLLFEGAGAIAGKASKTGIKALEDAGWMKGGKIVEGAQKAILHSTAQATAFGAVPFITNAVQGKDTSLDEFKQNAIFGGMMGLFHGGGKDTSSDKPTPADGSAAQVLARSPLIDLHNFMQSDMDAIKSAHDLEANPADLHIKAAVHANDAYYATSPEVRQDNIVQSSLNAKLASVKSFTNAILKDKDAVIAGVNELPDMGDAEKQAIIDKVNQVHKELDPIEQQKTALANQITELQAAPAGDIIAEKEKAVKLKDLNKQLDTIIQTQFEKSKNEQTVPNAELPVKAQADESVKAREPVKAVDEAVKNNLTTNPNKNESTNDEKGSGEKSSQSSQKESGKTWGKQVEGVSAEKSVVRERIADKDAPKVEELARNLKPKGKPGISVEPSYERAYEKPNDLTDKELENGQKYVVSRDKDGKVNGVLEVSYQSDKGVEKEPQGVKVAVDEGSRRQGIATALFKHAEEQGIDLKDVRGKATTDAGQALYEANKKGENNHAIKEIGQQESGGPKHQEGDKSRKTTKTSGSDSVVSAKQSEEKGKIRPNKEIKANQKIASNEVSAKYGLKPSDGEILFSQFKDKAALDPYGDNDEKDIGLNGRTVNSIHIDDIPPMLKGSFKNLIDKVYLDEYHDNHYLTEKGNKYIEAVKSRLQTRKGIKSGTDLFPRDAGLSSEEAQKLAKLPLAEHSELNNILRADHGISIKDLKDEHDKERNVSSENPAETATDAKAVQQPENDSVGNDGENRRGGAVEKEQGRTVKSETPGQDKQGVGKDLSPKAKKAVKQQSLSDEELNRKFELRKKFFGRLNDITNIPTLLADKEFREYAGLVFKEASGDFKAFSKELIDNVGEKIREHLPGLFKELGGKLKEASDEEQKATYGTKNAITEELQQGLGLPPIEIPKDRTDDESLAAWKDGKRTPQEITEQLLDPDTNIYDKTITPNDEPIMREYIRQLGERGRELTKIKLNLQEKADAGDEQAKFDIASVTQQINNHLDEYNNALNASKVGGNVWHKYGDERQKVIDDKGLILNAIERIKNIYGKDIPADVKRQLDDFQKRHDELVAKNEALQEKIKNGRAQEVFERAKSKRTILGTKKLTDAEFQTAKGDILEALKKDWKKSFAKTYATLPGIPQLNALAPHIAKLLKLYTDRGISKLDDIIRNIHDDVKDDIEGITQDDIKDLIAGRYSSQRPLSDLQKQVNELRTQARNKVKIAELEKGILAKAKAKGEASAEVKALQKEVAELKKKVINENASYSADELKKQAATIQKQIDKGEFAKQPVVKRKWETDPEWIKNNREKADLTFKLRKLEQEAIDSKKGKFMRSMDWGNRWGRRVIFFGANAVYTKLSSAAVLGSFLHRMPEQVLGAINAKMFPNIARTAPIEGNINLRNEGQWYLDFVNPKEFGIDVKDIIMRGETRLSKSMDTHPPGVHIPIVDLFAADGHQILKSTVKRATFNAAFNYQMDWFQKNGVDATHPMIIEAARQAAWQRANYEIFQDNPKNQTKVKEFFNQLERSGILDRNKPDGWSKIKGNAEYSAAALYHFFIPINTVPVNILKRVGLGLKLPVTYLEAIKKNKSVRDGILNMTHEESDAIMLQLKKGQISAAYWTLGFVLAGSMAGGMYTKFYPNSERDKDAVTPDADYLNFRGLNVSKDVQHNTQFQALQMGATWNMVHDHYVDDKGESQMMSIFAATFATAGVAAKEHPVISTALNIGDAIQTPHGNTKWVQDLRRRIGIQKAQDVFRLMGYDIGSDKEDYAPTHK